MRRVLLAILLARKKIGKCLENGSDSSPKEQARLDK